MSKKSLKRYNKETRQWEIVSSPDISMDVRLPDGRNITDNNVMITNENYPEDSTLNDALSNINENITRLERNVSWLDAHKGEGGGGGGGSQTYSISIISPAVENGSMYVKQDKIDVEFMISGPSGDDECTYSYSFNGKETTYKTVKVNSIATIKGLSLDASDFSTLTIKAKNPYGTNIIPVSVNIYKSSVSLVFDETAAGSDYASGVLNIKSDKNIAAIPFKLTNGIQNANLVITIKTNTEVTKDFTISTSASVGTTSQSINFWDVINKSSVVVGTYYVLTCFATSAFGSHAATSEPFNLRVKIINADALSITAGINGIDAGSENITVETGSLMRYSFKVYAPDTVYTTFYSAILKNLTKNTSELILGNYFSEEIKKEGATSYRDNDVISVGALKTSQATIFEENYSPNDNAQLVIKVWDEKGTVAELEQNFAITEADSTIFPKQKPPRINSADTGNTAFVSFNHSNIKANEKFKWEWNTNVYQPLSTNISSDISATMNVYDGNNSCGVITDKGTPYMRLQNHAYAVCDLSQYSDEIRRFTFNRNNRSFTISLTFFADSTSNEDDTIFFWGANNVEGNLSSGIKVTAEKAIWSITTKDSSIYNLECRLASGTKKTVDFIFNRETGNTSLVKICVNGIANCAKTFEDFGDFYSLPNEILFGANFVNGTYTNFGTVKIYDFTIFSKGLNDLQLAINGKEARINRESQEERQEYNEWKDKNFIYTNAENKPESLFLRNGEYSESFTSNQITSQIAPKSSIPTLMLYFDDSANFTTTDFYSKKEPSQTAITFNGIATYFDPVTNTTETINIKVSYQGTTTLLYRDKNLELYMADQNEQGKPYLFQPKETWFPESQFTLKADVVDSAHANNAVLGEWINNCDSLQPNPAMNALNSSTRPKDINDNGEQCTHKDSTGADIDYHEKVTIKHTLEGFPILLFIKFSDKQDYTFVGIYSFNLGRYSYYNMGLKFLKSFSSRDANNDIRCPKLIKKYEEQRYLGSVDSEQCYSFEFGDNGNNSVSAHPVWSQYDKTVVQSYGEFKYPTDISKSHPIWTELEKLFEYVAKLHVTRYYSDSINIFDGIKYYTINSNGEYVDTGEVIPQEAADTITEYLKVKLNITNAVVYFVIANAFGMTDSLGKNMVLRTWDGGATWRVCFYDMDTALGLSNTGNEDVPVTASIDKITMETSSAGTILHTTYHTSNDFAAAGSKLWGVLRDGGFSYAYSTQQNTLLYDETWNHLRSNGGQLSYAENFVSEMEERVNTCGEIVYNCDYYQKYIILDNAELKSSINFLHGTRVEYVRNWLKKHFYYLDGYFDVSRLNGGSSYSFSSTDSVYNRDKLNMEVFDKTGLPYLTFTVRVSTPTFLSLNIGNNTKSRYYISEANKDTLIYFGNRTSASSQLIIGGSTLVTKFNGLQGIFENFSSNNEKMFKSLREFDISNSTSLVEGSDSLDTTPFINEDNESPLETLSLAGVRKSTAQSSLYNVNLANMNNLINVDISSSQVSSIVLPESSLHTFIFRGSKLNTFNLSDQNRLTTLDFTGCNQLAEISITNCSAFETFNVSDFRLLTSVTLNRCASLTSVKIEQCYNLKRIEITDNPELEEVYIDEITNVEGLTISITGGKLKKLSVIYTNASKIELPSKANLQGLQVIKLNDNSKLSELTYFGETPAKYEGENVFDFSGLESLEEFSLSNVRSVKYIRFSNNPIAPFIFDDESVQNCINIKRIFGHILVSKSNVFNGLTNFCINDWDYTGYTENEWANIWSNPIFNFRTGDDVTNITFSDAANLSLSSLFRGTSCNIMDVIYAFKKIGSNVVNISYMFAECSNIEASYKKSLPQELFSNCNGVKNINGLFSNCLNLETQITPNMLIYVTGPSGITSFDSVFTNCSILIDVDYEFLFPANNKIERIRNFNPIYCYQDDEASGGYTIMDVEPIRILKNLTEVTNIELSYNDLTLRPINTIDGIEHNVRTEFMLLYGCIKLSSITNSFNDFICDVNYGAEPENYKIGYILGKRNDANYSDCLETIVSSFNTADATIKIGNQFFGNSANSIKNIRSSFEILKEIDFNDCGVLEFPYDIFAGCSNLETAEEIFAEMDCSHDGQVITGITLPNYQEGGIWHSMFSDCVALKNIPGLFKNMSNIRYSLNGEGFKNCQLEDVSYLFANGTDKTLIGGIPLKLFHMEDNNNILKATIQNMSYVFQGCSSPQGSGYTYNGNNIDGLKEWYLDDGVKKQRLNKYAYDGTKKFDDFDYEGFEKPEEYTYIAYTPFFDRDNVSDIISVETGEDQDTFDSEYTFFDGVENYFCPPDIFRYCENTRYVDVSGIFMNTSTVKGGFYGKIPPRLFEPISAATSLNRVFEGCALLLPVSWGRRRYTGETEYVVESGVRYPETLFDGMTNLNSISGIFAKNRMWGKTDFNLTRVFGRTGPKIIEEGQEKYGISNIKNISSLLYACIWINTGIEAATLSGNLYLLSNLERIDSMFRDGNGPSKLPSGGFITSNNNPNVYNCAYFMFNNRGIKSAEGLPTLWEGYQIMGRDYYKSAFYNVSTEIQNALPSTLPSGWTDYSRS